MTTGRLISFLGVDGVGKSTLAAALHDRLVGAGHRVVSTSRRAYLKAHGGPFPSPVAAAAAVTDWNRTLYDGALRSLYTMATGPEGESVGTLFPPPHGDLRDEVLEKSLGGAGVAANRPEALFAAALAEMAGALAWHTGVVLPEVARGTVVIEETHPYKMVTKLCVLAQRAKGTSAVPEGVALLRAAALLLGPGPLTLPVLLSCDVGDAYDRRVAQYGELGALEHYQLAGGGTDRDAYLDLQSRSQAAFEAAAALWQIPELRMERGEEAAVAAALDSLLAHERLAHLV
ncbi:hypothetical protein [Streptomyces albireticuli]|uniref:hypothetical protein n=1 Tax=Streptomyces albireticuli TaxID=1940 RepID=UPI0036C30584